MDTLEYIVIHTDTGDYVVSTNDGLLDDDVDVIIASDYGL